MKNATTLATFLFVAALTLTLRANSAPSKAKTCYNAEQPSDGRIASECEYHSLNTAKLKEDIETACKNIVSICPTVHRKLLGSNRTVSRIYRSITIVFSPV